jgi:hypothetical protein
MQSALGRQLYRLELYSQDTNGKRIPRVPRSWSIMPVRETQSHQNVTHLSEREEQEEATMRQARAASSVASLTADERRCLELLEARGAELDQLLTPEQRVRICSGGAYVVVTETVLRSDEDKMVAAGWHLRARPTKHTSDLVKNFPASLNHHDVAWIMGVTPARAHRLSLGAYRKLRVTRG